MSTLASVASPLVDQVSQACLNLFPESIPLDRVDYSLEVEAPLVGPSGYARLAEGLRQSLPQNGWKLDGDDPPCFKKDGFYCMPEASWYVWEVATPPFRKLDQLASKTSNVLLLMAQQARREHGLDMLGFGGHPFTSHGEIEMVRSTHYDLVSKALGSITWIKLTASQQCHVLADRTTAPILCNVFNALSGVLISLLAHCPVLGGYSSSHKAKRSLAYEKNCFPRGRIGILPKLGSLDDWVEYLLNLPLLYGWNPREREWQVCSKHLSLRSFLGLSDDVTWGLETLINLQGRRVWHEARIRPRNSGGGCTVEVRSPCAQRPGDFVFPALVVGIVRNLAAVANFVDGVAWDRWSQVREYAIEYGAAIPDHLFRLLTQRTWQEFAGEFLDLVEQGLSTLEERERAFAMVHLAVARDRVDRRLCPADRVIQFRKDSDSAGFLRSVSYNDSDC